MNEKKMYRGLLVAVNNGSLNHGFIYRMYRDDKRSLFNNIIPSDFVVKYFSKIINGCAKGYLALVVNEMLEHEDINDFVKNNLGFVLSVADPVDLNDLYAIEELKPLIKDYVNDNFDDILKEYPINKIIEIYKLKYEGKSILSRTNIDKIEEFFEDKKSEFISGILVDNTRGGKGGGNLEELNRVLTVFVDKVLKNENAKLTDIEVLSPGSFSNVIMVGNKVIKCGNLRRTYDMPNDERILQPVIRVNLSDLKADYNGDDAIIEVSERVDTDISISEEELYNIYKEMRDRGVVCADIKHDNIGRLIKDNNVYWNEEIKTNMNPGIEKKEIKVLKKGEYVVLDTDFIYREKDPKIKWGNSMAEGFEKRYIRENGLEANRVNNKR